MTYAETEYLRWANRWMGTVEHDLAKGGVRSVSLAELGVPPSIDDPRGWAMLREHVAHYNALGTDEVLPTLGTTHALWLALAVLVGPGDEVLVEAPAYEPLWRIPQGLGARVVRFERSPHEGYVASAERVAERLTSRTRVVVMSSLHNPSGVRTPPEGLEALARRCESVGARLLVDEVYAPYGVPLGTDGVWSGTARRVAPSVVAVSGLSKAYGLGSLRVGWIAAEPAVISAAQHVIQSTLGDPPCAQACLGAHAFSVLPRLAASIDHERARQQREQVAAWVRERPRLGWHEPTEGPFGFVLVEGAGDLTAILEQGAVQHGVLVAPGAFFGRPGAFRLAWASARDRMDDALERLSRVLALVPPA